MTHLTLRGDLSGTFDGKVRILGRTDSLFVQNSNSIPAYLRTTEQHPLDSRQPPPPLQNRRGLRLKSPAPVSTEDRSGEGGSSDGQDEQSRIVLPPETGEQPSLSSDLSDERALA